MSDNLSVPARRDWLAIAVTILTLAMFVLTAFQSFVLLRARANLTLARATQEKPMQDAAKLRQRAEALAGRAAKLAEDGNANVKALIENFHRQGVDIKPPAPTPPELPPEMPAAPAAK